MIQRLRSLLSPVKRWMAKPFIRAKVSPEQISLLGVVLAIAAALLLWLGFGSLASGVALLSILMDFIDGEVARQIGKVSAWGNYYEAIADKLVELFLALGFIFWFPFVTVYIIAVAFLIALLKARVGLVVITDNHDWPGFGDHAVRSVGLVWLYSWLSLGDFCLVRLGFWATFAVFVLLTLHTVWVRFHYAESLIRNGTLLPYLKQ